MKWSPILHGVSAIAGILGVLSLIASWIAWIQGSFLGLSSEHLNLDAGVLFLASIAFGVGTLIHQNQEKK